MEKEKSPDQVKTLIVYEYRRRDSNVKPTLGSTLQLALCAPSSAIQAHEMLWILYNNGIAMYPHGCHRCSHITNL
jgi:hypothetical protein